MKIFISDKDLISRIYSKKIQLTRNFLSPENHNKPVLLEGETALIKFSTDPLFNFL